MPTPMRRAVRIWNACPETMEWAQRFETLEEAWEICPRGDWLVAAICRADRFLSKRLEAVIRAIAELAKFEDPTETLRNRPRPDAAVWLWLGQALARIDPNLEVSRARVADLVREIVPDLLPAAVAPHRIRRIGREGAELMRKTRGGLDPLMGGE